jgi:heptosyltransferase-3
VQRILVYRLGSIGDFVVALPALHALRRRFPSAEIRLLTGRPVDGREASARSVLDGTGLVADYITYPVATRSLADITALRTAIRRFAPDLLVYLMSPRHLPGVVRDYVFFRLCGIRSQASMPFARELREYLPRNDGSGLRESEAQRLLRCLARMGVSPPAGAEGWDLHLSHAEIAEADAALRAAWRGSLPPDHTLVAMSIGTKQPIKDWGDDNWHAVLGAISRPDRALVLIGAAAERDRSEEVARGWAGPVANLCGLTSPRVSAAAVRQAQAFLGHDSGPMHLAAAVGTRCVVVFSKKNRPGEWFPFGDHHRIFYPPPEASSIMAIRPPEVIAAIEGLLGAAAQAIPARAG